MIATAPGLFACYRCKQHLPASSFNRDSTSAVRGLQSMCRECHRQIRPRHAAKNTARSNVYRVEHRLERWAHRQVAAALERCEIFRADACERCGAAAKLDGHHTDYEKPLDVVWLCRRCHLAVHREVAHA